MGAGAELETGVARAFVNIATQDTEGINLPGDFKVTAGPGRAVTIAPGGMTLRNRQRSGQSYIGTANSSTTITIPANSSGSLRRDLVIARIIDPDFAPWQPYTDPEAVLHGPYFEPFVVTGVGAGVETAQQAGLSYTAVALARVEIPSGASSITSGMIAKDCRRLARPRSGLESVHDVQAGPTPSQKMTLTDTSWKTWPTNTVQVPIPYWATRAEVSVTFQISVENPANVDLRVNLGGKLGPTTYFDYNGVAAGQGAETVQITAYAVLPVADIAGTTVTLTTQGMRTFVNDATGTVNLGPAEQLIYDVRFQETAV